jgi:RNA polymerase sigma-70 factor (ECF subfamily)
VTRIARNRAIDVLRKDRLRPERFALEWADPALQHATNGKTPSHAVELRLEQERVRKAVSELPKEQGLVLQLAFLQGYTHQEIATQLDTPLGTIKTRIRLGMKKLRDILQTP